MILSVRMVLYPGDAMMWLVVTRIPASFTLSVGACENAATEKHERIIWKSDLFTFVEVTGMVRKEYSHAIVHVMTWHEFPLAFLFCVQKINEEL